jgi:hypothetical protein
VPMEEARIPAGIGQFAASASTGQVTRPEQTRPRTLRIYNSVALGAEQSKVVKLVLVALGYD